jgi:hypothetical protein
VYSTSHYGQILRKIEFSQHIFEKYTNTKFHKILPEGAELFHVDGGTDRHDEANSRFAIFKMCLKSSSVIIPYMLHSFTIPKFVNNLRLCCSASPCANYDNTVNCTSHCQHSFLNVSINLSYNFMEANNFYKTKKKMKAVCVTRNCKDGDLIQMTHNFITF